MPSIADIPVALLAGGLATRLRPITETIPKALVEIAGKPFIDHQLALLGRSGIRKVVMCLGYRGEMVEAHCGDGSRYGMDLAYSFDGDKLMGTGGAIARAKHLLGDRPSDAFWVMYGDSYMDIDYAAVLTAFPTPPVSRGRAGEGAPSQVQYFQDYLEDQPPPQPSPGVPGEGVNPPLGLMTVLHNGDRWDTSNVIFENGRLVRYDKKNRTPEMVYIDYGVALLRRAAVDCIPTDRPFDLAELYTMLVAEGRMIGYEVFQRFYEIGTPHALEEARAYLAKNA